MTKALSKKPKTNYNHRLSDETERIGAAGHAAKPVSQPRHTNKKRKSTETHNSGNTHTHTLAQQQKPT